MNIKSFLLCTLIASSCAAPVALHAAQEPSPFIVDEHNIATKRGAPIGEQLGNYAGTMALNMLNPMAWAIFVKRVAAGLAFWQPIVRVPGQEWRREFESGWAGWATGSLARMTSAFIQNKEINKQNLTLLQALQNTKYLNTHMGDRDWNAVTAANNTDHTLGTFERTQTSNYDTWKPGPDKHADLTQLVGHVYDAHQNERLVYASSSQADLDTMQEVCDEHVPPIELRAVLYEDEEQFEGSLQELVEEGVLQR